MIKMVVFDMAGTVIDEDNVVYKTLCKAICNEGFDVSLNVVLQEGAGKEKLQAIKDILEKHTSNSDLNTAERVYENFKINLESAYTVFDIKPQHGAEVLFDELRKKNILVVLDTGYDLKTAQTILNKVGWVEGKQIDAMVTANHVTKNRPAPDMILYAKKKFNLTNADQVVKVGDSAIDIEEGKNANCVLNIGITTGAQTREQIQQANPDFIVDSLDEISKLIFNQS